MTHITYAAVSLKLLYISPYYIETMLSVLSIRTTEQTQITEPGIELYTCLNMAYVIC
jgi:hypothetical protein